MSYTRDASTPVVSHCSAQLFVFCSSLAWSGLVCLVRFGSTLLCSALFCSTVFCSVLFHCVLFHSVLFHSVLFCSVLFCSVLFCSTVFCSVLFCSTLFCSVPLCSILFHCVLFCSTLLCSVLFFSVLFCSALLLYCFQLHFNLSHSSSFPTRPFLSPCLPSSSLVFVQVVYSGVKSRRVPDVSLGRCY